MFERIIVPLDGSRLSAQAVPFAAEVAKRFDAEVILVRVLPTSGLSLVPSSADTENAATRDIIPAGRPHERRG